VTTLLNPLANQDDQTPDQFPKLSSLSAAFFYQFVPVPTDSQPPPEYVAIPCKGKPDLYGEVAAWNMIWEAGTLRYEMLDDHRWFKGLEWLKPFQTRGVDVRLIPLKGSCRYNIYAPLYHLLPLGTLKKFGLPPLKQGHWPGGPDWSETTAALPKDFQTRIENAFAHHVWRHLCPGSPLSGFSKQEPLVTLTHGLDFWLPYIDIVIQKRLKQLGRVKIENGKQSALLRKLRAKCPPNIIPSRPLFGGLAWMGESEALEATREMVEVADQYGRLRSIIDAIKSNRVEEGFSPMWSYAKEDFERKMYHKRNKVKIQFVQLDDTIPTHGPDAEVHEDCLWQSLFGILNPKERRIIICLRNGVTKLADIGQALGYANHSAVSKALKKIREKAKRLLS